MIKMFLSKIRRDGFLCAIKSVVYRFRRWLYRPSIEISGATTRLVTLGSSYGSWTLLDLPSLYKTKIVSCGAGEDISFDISFAARFDARVILVDPTPRAISHVKSVLRRVGSTRGSKLGDKIPAYIDACDLSLISSEQILLLEKALWTKRGEVRFFPPKDPTHVSHSIVDIQRTGSKKATYQEEILVPAITIQDIMSEFEIQRLTLLKLDIEGAEIEVLLSMLKSGIYPEQILVEFDGLNFPSRRACLSVKKVDSSLRAAGYLCYYANGQANYLYAIAKSEGI